MGDGTGFATINATGVPVLFASSNGNYTTAVVLNINNSSNVWALNRGAGQSGNSVITLSGNITIAAGQTLNYQDANGDMIKTIGNVTGGDANSAIVLDSQNQYWNNHRTILDLAGTSTGGTPKVTINFGNELVIGSSTALDAMSKIQDWTYGRSLKIDVAGGLIGSGAFTSVNVPGGSALGGNLTGMSGAAAARTSRCTTSPSSSPRPAAPAPATSARSWSTRASRT